MNALENKHDEYEALLKKANEEFADGRLDDSISTYLAAIRVSPYEFGAHMLLAVSYSRLNDFVNAKRELEITLAIKPDHIHALELLASLFLMEGKTHKVIDLLQTDVNIHLRKFAQVSHWTILQLANAYIKVDALERAREIIELGLLMYPSNEEMLLLRDSLALPST